MAGHGNAPRRRHVTVGRWLVGVSISVLGLFWTAVDVPSAAAADDCPGLPVTLAELIAVDEDPGPLSVAFRPVYGYYAERAHACFADQQIQLTGFVARPEGLGGVSEFTIEPAWLVSRAHALAATDDVDPDAGPMGPFLAVAMPPPLDAAMSGFQGRWVAVKGHFGDAAADDCVVTMGTPGPEVPTADQAIAICAASFVITSVEAALPPTDADAAGTTGSTAASPGGPVAWLAFLGGALVGAAAGGRAAVRRRRSR